MKKLPPERIAIITTGAQGEPTSALVRMANKDHRHIEIQAGDTVVLSSSAIPGNELLINRTIDNLYRQGANVLFSRIANCSRARARCAGRAEAHDRAGEAAILRARPWRVPPPLDAFADRARDGRSGRERLHPGRRRHAGDRRQGRPTLQAGPPPTGFMSMGWRWGSIASFCATGRTWRATG